MSDSSSDDDEPLMKSPCESENDSDDDDNVFRYDRRSFIKLNTAPDNVATPARAHRKRLKPSTDDQMSLLQKKQEKKQKCLLERIDGTNALNDDSDESIDSWKKKTHRGSETDVEDSIEILDDPGVISATVAAKQSKKTIDLEESSDEDDNIAAVRSRLQKSDPLLERSRMARRQLTLAQQYHAEDVNVDTLELEAIVPPLVVKPKVGKNKDMGTAEDLGETLQLACKILQEINGRTRGIIERQYSMKQNESIQKLVNKILLANSLPLSSRVKVTFDGMILEKHRTPESYGIKDEDQVDVDIAANIAPKLNDNRTRSGYGQGLNLKLRRRVEKNVEEIEMRIGNREPFQHLLDNYCRQQKLNQDFITLHFEGEKLDLSKTPLSYDMESQELVDVTFKGVKDRRYT